MQSLLEFLPVIAFVVAYKLSDFRTAVVVIMVAMTLQLGVTWLLGRTVNRMTLASAALVVIFGGVTLWLNNELIFKWKPTILNWVFAAIFLGSHFIGSRTIAQRLLQSVSKTEFALADRDWRILNAMWVVFFFISGTANLYVAYNFSEEFWVNFKLFGLLGLTVLFVLVQAAWLVRKDTSPTAKDGGGE